MPRAANPLLRIARLTAGVLLLTAAPLVSPLPGPGGTILAAGGLVLILRNSPCARHRFVRIMARWPRTGALIDRILARGSARRRRERAKHAGAN